MGLEPLIVTFGVVPAKPSLDLRMFPPRPIIYTPDISDRSRSDLQDVAMSLPGLPGLGLDEPEEERSVETTQHDLAKEHEWRFEVAVGKYAHVKVREPSSNP